MMKLRIVLVVLIVVGGAALFGESSKAQDEESCKMDCAAQHKQCVEVCGEHSNPIQCEADCRDDEYACHQDCER